MVEEGSLELALAVAVLLVGGTLLELLWTRAGFGPYYRLALPLGAELVPLPSAPTLDEGCAGGVRFRRAAPDRFVFWADPERREVPTLLHGVVRLVPAGGRCSLRVAWAPPWTPLLAALWLMGLGIARGEAQVTSPIATVMVFGLVVLYLRGARQAAAALRYGLAHGDADEPPAG